VGGGACATNQDLDADAAELIEGATRTVETTIAVLGIDSSSQFATGRLDAPVGQAITDNSGCTADILASPILTLPAEVEASGPGSGVGEFDGSHGGFPRLSRQ